jgi:hypothetical protein
LVISDGAPVDHSTRCPLARKIGRAADAYPSLYLIEQP